MLTHGKEVLDQFTGLQSGFTLSAFVPNNCGFFPRLVDFEDIMVRDDLVNSDWRNFQRKNPKF